MSDTIEKLAQIFKERHMVSESLEITGESRLGDDLGFDSLDAVEVSMVIEEEFGVIIDSKEFSDSIGKMATLARVVDERKK